tara:strand:- start:22 stop:831 length:810 start_codon:yes stop_codon:yes gene_type:complete
MADFIFDGNDGNFTIESGSTAVPVFKVAGNTVEISGSLIPGEAHSGSAVSELGSIDHPWKELYVESASINFVDTDLPSDNANRRTKFSKDDVDDIIAGKPPRGVKPLSRFSNSYGFNPRIGTTNARMILSSKVGGGSGRMVLNLGTSDIDGGTTSATKAFLASSFVAPQSCQVNAITVACSNPNNTDNMVLEVYKGTLVNDSSANVTLNKVKGFAFTIGATNKSYLSSALVTSGNTLSAGDFLMVTIYSPSVSGNSYPHFSLTIDGQYR